MALLVNGGTFSSAENFCVAFRSAARGPIIGTPTAGSTGNPIKIELGYGVYASICTKYEWTADGEVFIGESFHVGQHDVQPRCVFKQPHNGVVPGEHLILCQAQHVSLTVANAVANLWQTVNHHHVSTIGHACGLYLGVVDGLYHFVVFIRQGVVGINKLDV